MAKGKEVEVEELHMGLVKVFVFQELVRFGVEVVTQASELGNLREGVA